MKLSKKRRTAALAVGAAVLGGLGIFAATRMRSGAGPIPAPPQPLPGTVPEIRYQAGGESHLTLPIGREFEVTWDPSLPWDFAVQDTATTQAVDVRDGLARFRIVRALPTGSVDQIFVIVTDDNNNVLSEHKVTVHTP